MTKKKKLKVGDTEEWELDWIISKEEMAEVAKQQMDLYGIRGRMVESTIRVERRLNTLLTIAIIGKCEATENEFLFNEIILEEIMFSGKIRIFERLIQNIHSLKGSLKYKKMFKGVDTKKLLSNLKKLNKYRNRFAHGEIMFKGTQSYLFYSRNRRDKLTNNYFDKLNSLLNDIIRTLDDILFKSFEYYNIKVF